MADTRPPVRAEFAAFKHADWHGLQHGPCVVYLLAHAQREAFYIDTATGLGDIEKMRRRIILQQQATLPAKRMVPLLLVWFEPCADQAFASARAKQLRRWPHAWQRRLVETLNPAWVDLNSYALGFPGVLPQVGERHAVCRDLRISEDEQDT
ncbi:endonuclease [Xanthomonas fragariae]|uniref:endonuclease n=1 Tax=Xanthomonas fragariae TaxID=48664 RepID=UPI001EDEC17D|nr:endonuclease [Xanthomonas fragariae]